MNKSLKIKKDSNIKNKINIYYKNQIHKNCHIDEQVLKDIMNKNIKPTNANTKLNINIYYKK